jgi:zinc protease
MPATRSRATLPAPSLEIERHTLDNGLRVVLAPDATAPSVVVEVRYDVGFRSEPEGRTGFAHLFEHLLFEGSHSLEKLQHASLVQRNGGVFNGNTMPDATQYFEALPPNALELGLFLEADRMRAARLDDETLANQIAVVKEEIKVNVMNRPYGGFPWILLPPVLYTTFNNAHNGYGSFVDLENANVADAAAFFRDYYAPGNAVLVVAGAFKPADALAMIERQFGDIPGRRVPKRPSFAEPRPDAERRVVQPDPRATLNATAVGYRVPDPVKAFDDYLAALLGIDVLADGTPSRLHQRLVTGDRLVVEVAGYAGTFGEAYSQRDPVISQFMMFHPGPLEPVLAAFDEEVHRAAGVVTPEELDRVVIASAAQHLRNIDDLQNRAMLLAALEQVHGRTELVNELPQRLRAVTPEAVAAAIGTWFATDRRAVLEIVPGAPS